MTFPWESIANPSGVGQISGNSTSNLVEVYLNSNAGANNYAKITVNGVTTLDLTDFEFA